MNDTAEVTMADFPRCNGEDDSENQILVKGIQEWRSCEVTGNTPSPRCWFGYCQVKNKLIIFGGYNGKKSANSFLSDVYVLNLDTLEWSEIQTSGQVPSSHTAIAIGSDIAVIGGKNKDGGNLEVYWYNTELKAWWQPTIEGIQPSNRYAHSTILYQAKLYIWGGFNGLYTYNDLYVLDIDPQRRSRNLKMPVPQLGLDLKSLLNNDLFSDVTFLVEEKKIFAHRNILAARCEYFRSMFTHKLRESGMNEVVINGVSYTAFLDFLKYVYTEALDIDVDQAVDLLEVANLYQSDKLKTALSYILENHMDIENCCRLFMHSHHHQAKELENVAFVFITKNFDIVRSTKGYKELSDELVQTVLKAL